MVVPPRIRRGLSQEVRSQSKKIITRAMGGKCCICGYNKCIQALEFHHVNPHEKDFHFNKIHITKNSWPKICNELRKCVLLCANCHREAHSGFLQISEDVTRFDEQYANYEQATFDEVTDFCPVCSNIKMTFNKTCSSSCAAKYNVGKINWDEIDLKSMIENGMSYHQISNKLEVSASTVSKRAMRLDLKSKVSK